MVKTRRMAAAGCLLGLLVLAGCGSGQDAATTHQLPSVPGVDMQDGDIAVRNVAVAYDADGYQPGDTVPVDLVVFNQTDSTVRMTDATSTAAASVAVAADGGTTLQVPAYGYSKATLELTGIRSALNAADSVPLELTFDNGATFAMEVPVAPPLQRVGEREPVEMHEEH